MNFTSGGASTAEGLAVEFFTRIEAAGYRVFKNKKFDLSMPALMATVCGVFRLVEIIPGLRISETIGSPLVSCAPSCRAMIFLKKKMKGSRMKTRLSEEK